MECLQRALCRWQNLSLFVLIALSWRLQTVWKLSPHWLFNVALVLSHCISFRVFSLTLAYGPIPSLALTMQLFILPQRSIIHFQRAIVATQPLHLFSVALKNLVISPLHLLQSQSQIFLTPLCCFNPLKKFLAVGCMQQILLLLLQQFMNDGFFLPKPAFEVTIALQQSINRVFALLQSLPDRCFIFCSISIECFVALLFCKFVHFKFEYLISRNSNKKVHKPTLYIY